MGIERLKARGDRPVAAPGKFRAARIAEHRSFEEIVTDVGPVNVTALAATFKDARKKIEARPDLVSSEGKAEIARLEGTAAPTVCPCCEYFESRPAGVDHPSGTNDECTCVEGCPNA